MSVSIKQVQTRREYGFCAGIRALVFLEEQKCEGGLNVEYDEYEDEGHTYLMFVSGEPVATARYRILDDGRTGKIERIAVLKEHRGKGYGAEIVSHLTEALKNVDGVEEIMMSAQDQALPFYEKLGYAAVGEGYLEAGIPHHKITMNVE